MSQIQIYLVGGAVRDELLGLPILEKDWVVVGATPQDLLNKGYTQVGKNFPVFLHPQTHEEYALARKELKSGKGYHGFICDFSPDVTLEEDLIRRDLTINAIAKSMDGHYIDPCAGIKDIHNKILRHVSDAFIEDPLRVLRTARFLARFHYLGFKIASETETLMKKIVALGELSELSKERIWKEWSRAMTEPNPEMFIITLQKCSAVPDYLLNYPTQALTHVAQLTKDLTIRLTFFLKDLPSKLIQEFNQDFLVPKQISKCIELYSHYAEDFNLKNAKNSEEILNILEKLDAFRQKELFQKLLQCHQIDSIIQRTKDFSEIWQDILIECSKIRLPQNMQNSKNIANIQNYFSEERKAIIYKKVF